MEASEMNGEQIADLFIRVRDNRPWSDAVLMTAIIAAQHTDPERGVEHLRRVLCDIERERTHV